MIPQVDVVAFKVKLERRVELERRIQSVGLGLRLIAPCVATPR